MSFLCAKIEIITPFSRNQTAQQKEQVGLLLKYRSEALGVLYNVPMQNLELSMASVERKKGVRRDALENRNQILKVAAELFAQNGVEQVCMSDIAKAAHVGKGTLYRRFANKGELCLALLDSELKAFQNNVMDRFREMGHTGGTGSEQLAWFIEEAVGFTATYLPLMVEISSSGAENGVQDVNQPHFWMEMTVKGFLKEMVQARLISADYDLDYLTSAILAPLDARILKNHLTIRGYTVEQVSSGLQTLIRNLYTPGSR